MSADYWQKQQVDKPLFPDILWSRPESKAGAGKLGIIGGNGHGFSAPGIAYNMALQSGVGVVRVVMPDAVKKAVKLMLPEADFAVSNPSGSFAKKALDELLIVANWSNATLLAGDLGRNSETAVLLESFVEKYSGQLIVTQDAVDYFKETPRLIIDRSDTLIVLSLAQLQRLFIATPNITAITYSMSTQQLVEALHEYSLKHTAGFITKHNDLLFIAHNGRIVTQQYPENVWRVDVATRAAVFWLQEPTKLLEATATSLVEEAA